MNITSKFQANCRQASQFVDDCQISLKNNIQAMEEALALKCHEAAQATRAFIYENSSTLFFTGCTCATAYLAPQLFFPACVVTILFRVQLKALFDEYIKDEHNPYLPDPRFGPNYISISDLTLATVGAIDALALGTLFSTHSLAVIFIPALAGMAAGNCLAKLGMDITHSFSHFLATPLL